jgi:endonuclease YncB( thermonuclease family)
MPRLIIILFILFAALLQVTGLSPRTLRAQDTTPTPVTIEVPDRDQLDEASVIRVVAGDTVRVDLAGRAETLRLIGVDTPETVDPRGPVECVGRAAADFVRELLEPGSAVWLETDVSDADRYGRLLRYVWVENPDGELEREGAEDDDLVLVNLLLVADGVAIATPSPPDLRHQDALDAAERQARAARRGLWGDMGRPPRCRDAGGNRRGPERSPGLDPGSGRGGAGPRPELSRGVHSSSPGANLAWTKVLHDVEWLHKIDADRIRLRQQIRAFRLVSLAAPGP